MMKWEGGLPKNREDVEEGRKELRGRMACLYILARMFVGSLAGAGGSSFVIKTSKNGMACVIS